MTEQMVLTLNIPRVNKKEKHRQRRYIYQICIIIILIIIIVTYFIMILMISFLLPEKSGASEVIDSSSHQPEVLSSDLHASPRYIYIDIGCFNGETVEHFLHFVPNSTHYDIITFEPDPVNYQLCAQRLTQKKYAHINITILQKVVWIRDEKVFFQTNRGRFSRIHKKQTIADGSIEQLDAIDFSSWLARLAKLKKTKITIKMSMYGAEVPVLEKMILDNTLGLADKYEIEWTDRENSRIRSTRIYIQLMFDNRGFDLLYYTCLQDARKVFKIFGTFQNVKKHYDWRLINDSDTFAHFKLRPDRFELPLKLTRKQQDTK